MASLAERPANAVVGLAVPHEDAVQHVTGAAEFTDDLVSRYGNLLHAYPVQATRNHARVTNLDLTDAKSVPGVVSIIGPDDIPGLNDSGVKNDEPLMSLDIKHYGQVICWVLAESLEAARLGAESVKCDYIEHPSILTLAEAISKESFQGTSRTLRRGDAVGGLAGAAHVFQGELDIGGQEHFYLETQASIAYIDEGGSVFVHSSTQHPTHNQKVIAQILNVPSHRIVVQSLRMGGAFGGKETQGASFAAVAALGAVVTGRPVRVRLTRAQDMSLTGKRSPFHARWEVGFDKDGKLLALTGTVTVDGGWSLDQSEAILGRALTHIDNAYYVPNVEVFGRIAKTNKVSFTAFRGFGGPQGMLIIEDILGRCAPLLGLTGEELRRRNFYEESQTTPYLQPVRHAKRMHKIWCDVQDRASFAERRASIDDFNAANPNIKRGLAITPVKYGISFNISKLNQAGALVLVYQDGSVLINHGGTEMGQGLHTKMRQVAATALGVGLGNILLAPTRTDKVPNTSATAASSGSDLNGGALKNACEILRERLANVAARMLDADPNDVSFVNGRVHVLGRSDSESFTNVVSAAYDQRVSLFSNGFYRTEGIHWDGSTMTGSPFKYFAYGAAVAEVEIDGYTGIYRIRRVDIVHDVGESLSPLIDIGQIEGAFIQGMGWLTLEELVWDASESPVHGRLSTQGASTYKLPSFSELPDVFRVHFYEDAVEPGVVYGSKAVGEPPLMLAFSVREALRDGVAAFGPVGYSAELASPATPEAVFWALDKARNEAPEVSDVTRIRSVVGAG